MILIAAKTGWPEEFILWNLPLGRGHAYLHTIAVMDGQNTRWLNTPDPLEQWLDQVHQWATAMKP